MKIFLAIAMIASFSLASASGADPSELTFCVAPNEMLVAKDELAPLAGELSKAIGIPVKLMDARTHAGTVEAIRSNKAQLAWLCNRAAVEAIDTGNAEIFAEIDGSQGDKTCIIVRKDSALARETDQLLAAAKAGKPMRIPTWLAGLEPLFNHSREVRFLGGEPLGTAGFLSSHFFFSENGVDPAAAFKSFDTGGLEANALAVAIQAADAAVFKHSAMEPLAKLHPDEASRLRVICRGHNGGNDPLVWRADLPGELKEKIRTFFLAYATNDAGRAKLAAIKWLGFLPASNAHVNPYRYLLTVSEKSRLEKNGTAPSTQKQDRLAELDTQIKALKALGGWHIPHRKPIDYTKPIEPQLRE